MNILLIRMESWITKQRQKSIDLLVALKVLWPSSPPSLNISTLGCYTVLVALMFPSEGSDSREQSRGRMITGAFATGI